MADKNVKKELNAENLEGVAGGANQNIEQVDGGRNPWHDDDEPSFATGSMTKEELPRQGGTDGNRIHKPLINVENH